MSLGFGILFATLLIMIVVPALAVTEDRIRRAMRGEGASRRQSDPLPGVEAMAQPVAGD